MSIEEIVRQELDGCTEMYLKEIVAHGIHNLTNDFHGESDEEYEAYSEEFERQAQEILDAEHEALRAASDLEYRIEDAVERLEYRISRATVSQSEGFFTLSDWEEIFTGRLTSDGLLDQGDFYVEEQSLDVWAQANPGQRRRLCEAVVDRLAEADSGIDFV